jgi:cystathionine gamma-synthase
VVIPHDCYGGTYRLFNALALKGTLQVQFVDFGDGAALEAALVRRPAMVWIETPSNPLLRIVDIAATARAARAAGALVVADNTFLSPVWQRPIELGAEVVVHSTTKYLNGHSDVVGGAVIAATPELHEKLAWWGNCIGVTGSAFDSYLTLRGLRTLHARMRAHGENALRIVEALSRHQAIARVYFPGLEEHPGHAIARRQQQGYGAMVSCELKGDVRNVRAFLDTLELFSLAESLGGVESLVAHPASMTHAAMDETARRTAGITDTLVRLSIGIEAADDLVRDLDNALAASARAS